MVQEDAHQAQATTDYKVIIYCFLAPILVLLLVNVNDLFHANSFYDRAKCIADITFYVVTLLYFLPAGYLQPTTQSILVGLQISLFLAFLILRCFYKPRSQ